MSLIAAAMLALSSQSPVPAAPEGAIRLNCRAVAVNGTTVDFPFELRGAGAALEGRIPGRGGFAAGSRTGFRIGGLPGSFFVDVDPIPGAPATYYVTVLIEEGGVAGFPVASGICLPSPHPAAPRNAAGFAQLDLAMLEAAADSDLPCFMLTLDGQVSRFETRLSGEPPAVERIFEPQDRLVWTSPRRSTDNPLPRTPPRGSVPIEVYSIFSGGDGSENPTGLSTGFIDPPRRLAVGRHLFANLGADNATGRRNAVAICAIRLGPAR